jgi:hypothetical protein
MSRIIPGASQTKITLIVYGFDKEKKRALQATSSDQSLYYSLMYALRTKTQLLIMNNI